MENDEQLIKMRACSDWRGIILHLSVAIETAMDELIVAHFCKDKERAMEFIHAALSKENFSFGLKKDLTIFILKNHHQDVIAENPSLPNDLKEIVERRNTFAHKKFFVLSKINTEHEDKIFFEDYRTVENKMKVVSIELSIQKMKEWTDIMISVETLLRTIKTKIHHANGSIVRTWWIQ